MQRRKPFGHNKQENIRRRTEEEERKEHEPSFRRRLESSERYDRWMQHATRRPGRTREFLHRKYGDKAFTREGTIKEEYLDEAIREAKEHHETALERRLVLARTYKRYGR